MIARWSLPMLAAMALQSCKTPDLLCVAPSGLNRLTITTEPDTNGGLATEIDLVFVTDMKAYKTIESLKARDYFAQREQLVRDFPSGFKIRSFGLEPTKRQVDYKTEAPCSLVGTLVFVNYNSDKPNRIRLDKGEGYTDPWTGRFYLAGAIGSCIRRAPPGAIDAARRAT